MTSVDRRARSIRLISYVGGVRVHRGSAAGEQKDTPASCRLNALYLTIGDFRTRPSTSNRTLRSAPYTMHEVNQEIPLFRYVNVQRIQSAE